MESRNQLSLANLSSEIIVQILHQCEYPTILRFAATCQTYRSLVAHSTSLQLHIELEANGLELVKDSFQRDASYPAILEDLRRFRDGWLDLNIEQPVVRSLGNSEMLLWELREGFYVKAFSQSRGQFADALQFVPLDHETPDPPPLMFDFVFSEFTTDPAQDLIAMISGDPNQNMLYHIYLYSMGTGLTHPLAQYPRLTAELDFGRPSTFFGFAIEIMAHVVLAKISDPRTNTCELLIWDWRSGVLLHRIASQEGFCDFSFLDQQHFVVLSVTGSTSNVLSLLIYELSDITSARAPSQKQVRVGDYSTSRPILRLEFPQVKESSSVSRAGFFLRSDPTPGRIMYKNSAAFLCPYTMTLGMTVNFRQTDYEWAISLTHRAFIDGRYLLDQVHKAPRGGTAVLPWSLWGTNTTRWFITQQEPDHWICWMSGSRFVCSFADPPYHCIFDFFSPTVGRFRERFSELYPAAFDRLIQNSEPVAGNKLQDLLYLESYLYSLYEDSPLSSDPIVISVDADNPAVIDTTDSLGFAEPIVSRLPYRIVFRTNNEEAHEGCQINGDCIIGIDTWGSASETISIYKLKNGSESAGTLCSESQTELHRNPTTGGGIDT